MQNATFRNSLALIIILAGGLLAFYWRFTSLGEGGRPGNDAAHFRYVVDLDFWQRTEREQTVLTTTPLDLAHNLNAVPLQIGQWQGQDVPETNQEVFILLEPEQFVQRLYQDQAGHQLWLTLIGGRNSRTFHPLDLCYEADGWKTSLSSQRIPLNGAAGLDGLWLEAQKSAEDKLVENRVFYFYLFPNNRRDPADGIVFLKITTPPYGNVEETLAIQGDFLRGLFSQAESTGEK